MIGFCLHEETCRPDPCVPMLQTSAAEVEEARLKLQQAQAAAEAGMYLCHSSFPAIFVTAVTLVRLGICRLQSVLYAAADMS